MALAAMHPRDDVSRTTSTSLHTTTAPPLPPTSGAASAATTATTTATSPQSAHPRLPSVAHLYQPESATARPLEPALPSLGRTPTPLTASPLRRSLPTLPSTSHAAASLSTPRVIGDPLLRGIPPPPSITSYGGTPSTSYLPPPPPQPTATPGPSARRLSVPLPLRGEKRKSDLVPPPGTNIKDYCAVLTPFIYKLYCLVSDEATNDLCCWSDDGLAFLVRDPTAFAASVLPNYFKHNQFSSFVRQLNKYRFHKLAPGAFLFGHERFVRGRPDLLREIGRQRSPDRAPVQASAPTPVTPASPATKRQRIRDDSAVELESVRATVAHETAPLRGDIAALRRENAQLNARVQQMEDVVGELSQHVKVLQSLIQHQRTSQPLGHVQAPPFSAAPEHFGYATRRALQRRSLPLPPPQPPIDRPPTSGARPPPSSQTD